jgi:hypothetical protein
MDVFSLLRRSGRFRCLLRLFWLLGLRRRAKRRVHRVRNIPYWHALGDSLSDRFFDAFYRFPLLVIFFCHYRANSPLPQIGIVLSAELLLFPHDILRLLVIAQGNELGMAQVAHIRPLNKLKLPDQLRLHPPAFPHFLRRKPRAPASGLLLRKVCERAFFDFQRLELFE